MHAFVADITRPGALAGPVPAGTVDTCTLVFVLSAVAPEKMPQVLFTLALTPGRPLALHACRSAPSHPLGPDMWGVYQPLSCVGCSV